MDVKLVTGGLVVFLTGAVLYFLKVIQAQSTLIIRLAFIGLILLGIVVCLLGLFSEERTYSVTEEPTVAEEPEPEFEEPKIEEVHEAEPVEVEEVHKEEKHVVADKSQIRETERLINEVAQSMKHKKKK